MLFGRHLPNLQNAQLPSSLLHRLAGRLSAQCESLRNAHSLLAGTVPLGVDTAKLTDMFAGLSKLARPERSLRLQFTPLDGGCESGFASLELSTLLDVIIGEEFLRPCRLQSLDRYPPLHPPDWPPTCLSRLIRWMSLLEARLNRSPVSGDYPRITRPRSKHQNLDPAITMIGATLVLLSRPGWMALNSTYHCFPSLFAGTTLAILAMAPSPFFYQGNPPSTNDALPHRCAMGCTVPRKHGGDGSLCGPPLD